LTVKEKPESYLNEWMASPRYMEMIKTSAPKTSKNNGKKTG
jgi:hypothetical protein